MTFNFILCQGLPGKCLYKNNKKCRNGAPHHFLIFDTFMKTFSWKPLKKKLKVISIRINWLRGPFMQSNIDFQGNPEDPDYDRLLNRILNEPRMIEIKISGLHLGGLGEAH